MSARFAALGQWVAQHPRIVIAAWLLAVLVGGAMAQRLPEVVLGGSGALPGSASQRVEAALHTEFDRPMAEPLLLALSSQRYTLDDVPYRQWVEAAATRLRAHAAVRRVKTPFDDGSLAISLQSEDAHHALLLIDLQATDTATQERVVPAIRAALAPLKQQMLQADPDARFAITGRAASNVDINEANRVQGDRAEQRALPLTLLILLVCFGALAAAGLPLLAGLAVTLVSLGLAWALAHVMPVSNLLQNVVTMLGLALGIDYALLMVSRFREALPGRDARTAVAEVVAQSGGTIAGSGLTVIVGLLGLTLSPLLEIRSIGIGGALATVLAVLAALTLQPALLALLGPRIDWPCALSRRLTPQHKGRGWRKLGEAVVRRPLLTLLASTALVALIAWPGLGVRFGFDADRAGFPAGMESFIASDVLTEMDLANSTLPILLVVRAQDGREALDEAHMPALLAYSEWLAAHPQISTVASPVIPDDSLPQHEWVSRDGRALLFQLIPDDKLDLDEVRALARALATHRPAGAFAVEVGGPAVYYNDYVAWVNASFPRVVGFVIGSTLLLLFLMFRSWLLPLKAVLTNLLAVAAGFGAVVAVFQHGWMAAWFGISHQFSAIPIVVPLLCFCLSFGLSMDYEVFLLRDIQRHYRASGDNRSAVVEGLVHAGPIITGAALVMATVFGAFLGTDLAMLKMIGLGLTITVLVDATLVRALIVPSVMCLAGRWNWLPGLPQAAHNAADATPRKRRGFDNLQALNRQSDEREYTIDDIDWTAGIDRTRPWAPDGMGPLWFTGTLDALDARQRLRCNQLQALAISEKFIWLETQLIRTTTRAAATRALPAPLDEALAHFRSEESKHVAMFWRLLQTAEPVLYPTRTPRLFTVSRWQQWAIDRVARHPHLLLAWIWLAVFVEERTLFLSREYALERRRAPGQLDPLHAQVHDFHFRDEVRHCQLDQHLLTWLYDPQPQWKKRIAGWMFRRMVAGYVGSGRTAARIARQLGEEFPELQARIVPNLLAELSAVHRDPDYHRRLFSPAVLPRTLTLLAEYPEHDAVWACLPAGRDHA